MKKLIPFLLIIICFFNACSVQTPEDNIKNHISSVLSSAPKLSGNIMIINYPAEESIVKLSEYSRSILQQKAIENGYTIITDESVKEASKNYRMILTGFLQGKEKLSIEAPKYRMFFKVSNTGNKILTEIIILDTETAKVIFKDSYETTADISVYGKKYNSEELYDKALELYINSEYDQVINLIISRLEELNEARFYRIYGMCLYNKGEFSRAYQNVKKAYNLERNVENGFNLGVIAAKTEGEYLTEAVEILREYYINDQESEKISLQLAYLYTKAKSKTLLLDGFNMMTNLIKKHPDKWQYHYTLGLILEKLGNNTDAQSEYQKAGNLGADYNIINQYK